MTVAELVEKVREDGIDVHPDHIRNIELGHKQPSPKLAGAISRALAIPKHVLLVTSAPFQPSGQRPRKTGAAKRAARESGGKPGAERKAS